MCRRKVEKAPVHSNGSQLVPDIHCQYFLDTGDHSQLTAAAESKIKL